MKQKLELLSIVFLAFISLWCITDCFADDNQALPQVIFTISSDKWISSDSANVTIAVHALLTEQQLADAQKNILESLQRISSAGNWKITQIQRMQNQANLEQLEVLAEARLPINALSSLRAAAEQESKQGEKYEIQSIDYSPSNSEMEIAQADLRSKIYQAVKEELGRINNQYPGQHYYLFSINFLGFQPVQPLFQKVAMAATAAAEAPQPATPPNNVSQHLTLSAQVILSHSL